MASVRQTLFLNRAYQAELIHWIPGLYEVISDPIGLVRIDRYLPSFQLRHTLFEIVDARFQLRDCRSVTRV